MSKQDEIQRVGNVKGDMIFFLIDRNPHGKGHYNKNVKIYREIGSHEVSYKISILNMNDQPVVCSRCHRANYENSSTTLPTISKNKERKKNTTGYFYNCCDRIIDNDFTLQTGLHSYSRV